MPKRVRPDVEETLQAIENSKLSAATKAAMIRSELELLCSRNQSQVEDIPPPAEEEAPPPAEEEAPP